MTAALVLFASNGVRAALDRLGPACERASGRRLAIRYDAAAPLQRAIEAGEPCDAAILTEPAMAALTVAGHIAPASRAALARSGIGVAVKAGAALPDIATPAALCRALLAARSVAYTTEGASGGHFARLIERLGIADAVRAKAVTQPAGLIATRIVSGEAELAVQQVSEILAVPGVVLAGPLPEALQCWTWFVAGIAAAAREPAAAAALIAHLAGPAARPALAATGLEPAPSAATASRPR